MIRLAWLGTFGLCLLLALGTFIWQKDILAGWQIYQSRRDLWITVLVVLFSFWLPMFCGRAAGAAKFFLAGLGQHFQWRRAAGCRRRSLCWRWALTRADMMLGVLLGLAVGVGVGHLANRSLWLLHAEPSTGAAC